jgi:hypothetical protein
MTGRYDQRVDTIASPSPSESLKSENTPESSVLRIKQRKRGWVPISRALIDDSRLQFDTRAIANWLIAKPDGWQIRVGALPYLLQQRAGPGERMGRDRVRRMLRELEHAGYLRRARSKKSNGRWVWRIEFSDTPEPAQRDTAAMDGSAVDGRAAGGSPVDGQGVDLLDTLNNSRLEQSRPTTTARGEAKANGVVVASMMEIRYPPLLHGKFLASARRLIDGCPPEQRQAVLDEVDAMHRHGQVRSPLGLLKSLVDKAGVGQFLPNYSVSVAPGSSTKISSGARADRSLTGDDPAPRPSALASDIGRETLSRLREKLKPDCG